MSFSATRRRNRGAYDTPFSGVGVEFFPLGVAPDHGGITLHETGYLPRNERWIFPNVFSPFWRLYYNFDAGHKVVFPDGEVPLTPRHLMLIPDRRLFHCHGRPPAVRTFWIAFSLARGLDARQRVPLLLRPSRSELALIRRLAQLIGTPQEDGQGREPVMHLSLALLHLLLARPEIQWGDFDRPEGIRRAEALIERRLADTLSVPELARAAGMSVRSFSASFKRCLGITPARYHTQIRAREAAGLLVHTATPIEQVSTQTGFPNRDYFTRVFKKLTGEAPAGFRRRHRIRATGTAAAGDGAA